ncbi:MAG: hypothetical protein ACEPOW_12845 [Bacteroidales bacterium]
MEVASETLGLKDVLVNCYVPDEVLFSEFGIEHYYFGDSTDEKKITYASDFLEENGVKKSSIKRRNKKFSY